MFKNIKLHTAIFLGMLVGTLAGVAARYFLEPDTISAILIWTKPIGDIFMRFIFMMVIPLVIAALTLGVAEFGEVSRLGKIGLKMFKYTLVVTGISVMLGVGLVNVFQPGKRLAREDRVRLEEQFAGEIKSIRENADKGRERNIGQIITNIVPKNPFEDMTRAYDPTYTGGGLLAIMLFALILGIALSNADPDKTAVFKKALEGLYELTMIIIGYAMKLAPIGVAALLFGLTAQTGLGILNTLLGYMVLVLAALAIHQFITYSVILKFFSGMSPAFFFRQCRELMATAFGTSSSNATLPVAIRTATEKLKLPKDISHFVLTLGSTANQNGTALYEGITILFLAQCFGVDLSLADQLMVVFVSVLAGMGTAGVPGGSLPVMMLILETIKVPGASIIIILGVDRILDMSRTVLNVTGDVTAAAYISYTEGHKPEEEAAA